MKAIAGFLACSLFLWVASLDRAGADTTLTDSTFAGANWQVLSLPVYPGYGTVAANVTLSPTASGGNTGSFMTMSLDSSVYASGYRDFAGMISPLLTYDPSTQGAITSLSYSVDLEGLSSAGLSYESLLMKQGDYYFAALPYELIASTSDWTQYGGAYTATYGTYDASGNPWNSMTPDFSSSGAPITFGLVSTGGYSDPIENTIGVDNFKVVIQTAPEPATWLLLLAAMVPAFIFRRYVALD